RGKQTLKCLWRGIKRSTEIAQKVVLAY
ncbi:MAG: hypothetical protein RLZZ422_2618, partial [Pseudomonadota bacterium]